VEGILGVLTGALAIVTPVAIVLIIFGFRHLRYVQRQRTIRMALEKGLDPSPLLAEEVAAGPALGPSWYRDRPRSHLGGDPTRRARRHNYWVDTGGHWSRLPNFL
jgi:hypothetical protein